MMGIWVHPYAILHVLVWVNFKENGGVWPSLYANPQKLHPKSILDVYKVSERLEMLWMGMLYTQYMG